MHSSDTGAQPALIGTREAAEILGVPRTTLASRLAAGAIAPAIKLPGRTGAFLFDRAYIEKIAADERDATQRRSALAAAPSALAAAPSAPEDYAIQDERTGTVILHAFHGSIDGGDAA